MQESRSRALISQWRRRFAADSLAEGVVFALRNRADAIWQGTFTLLQLESPEYRNAVDDEFAVESKGHCSALLRMIIAIADGSAADLPGDPFDFVRVHATWRARHRVPLIASLHAYRLAHRTYLATTREALLAHPKQEAALQSLAMLSDFWIEFFDHVGAVLAEAHALEDELIAAQSAERSGELVADLLRGVAPEDPEARQLCAVCGIKPGAALAVAVIRPAQAGALDREVSLRAYLRLVEQVLPPAKFGKLAAIRNGEAVVIACSDGETGRSLADALRRSSGPKGRGETVHVGVSLDTEAVAGLKRALEEAGLAADFANAAQTIMHFAEIELPEFLIRRADSTAIRLIPAWVHRLEPGDDDPVNPLSRTIRAFAECSFNVKRTAQRLGVHANTVYFRLNRISKLTGLDPRTYSGTTQLLTALRLQELAGGVRET